jgi:predicted RNA binding protein YcfA (HicA-like mRNA interferase family)
MSRLPNLRPKEVVAALKRYGFEETHQKGSHLYLISSDKKRMTSVPIHPGDLHRGLLKQILKQAGISESDFRELI